MGRGVDHPPPSSAEVKERVELYLYSPSGPSWLVLGRTLPLLYMNTAVYSWLPPIKTLVRFKKTVTTKEAQSSVFRIRGYKQRLCDGPIPLPEASY
jgi:hypothetical protein